VVVPTFVSTSDSWLDIDDTIKVSNVLDKAKLLKATLIDDPTPVTGMPELYASLARSLNSPQFLYVSGSPFQLFPFLRGFVNTTFQASQGPIFLRNLTLNINDLVQLTQSDGVLNYKLSQIDRIHGMYPAKKFLTVGDSTEKDPETYGETYVMLANI
jgi:phosphatidate phosphatase APP1